MTKFRNYAGAAAVTLVAAAFMAPQALAANYPSSFDLRHADLGDGVTRNYVTSVKNQDPWGTCWSFASTSAAETNVLVKLHQDAVTSSGGNSLDFSERQLAWFAYDAPVTSTASSTQSGEVVKSSKLCLDAGGGAFMAAQVFAQGTGVSEESESKLFAYQGRTGFDEEDGKLCQCMDINQWSIPNALRFTRDYELEGFELLPSAMDVEFDDDDNPVNVFKQERVGTIKAELLAGHGVTADIYSDQSTTDDVESGTYMNTETSALYVDRSIGTTHTVAVVGWDDNYDASNFNEGHRPPGNGAWICKNSWGAKSQTFPNNGDFGIDGEGYFYLSYYDLGTGSFGSFDFDIGEGLPGTATTRIVEQNDYIDTLDPNVGYEEKPAVMANVFTASYDEVITHVSCVTAEENVKVSYQVYKLDSDAANPKDGTLVWEDGETYATRGYHRIKMDKTLALTQGQRFSVVVSEEGSNGQYMYNWNQMLTKDYYDANPEMTEDGDYYYGAVKLNAGESLLYTEAKNVYTNKAGWNDLTAVVKAFKRYVDPETGGAENKYTAVDNFSIKAYGDYSTSGVSLDGASITLSKSEYVYDGELCEPDVAVTTAAGKRVPSSAYSVSYSGNGAVGSAKVTVTGKNGCSGTASKSFTILPKKITFIKMKSCKKRKLVVKWTDFLNSFNGVKPAYKAVFSCDKKKLKTRTVKAKAKKKIIYRAPKRFAGKKVKVTITPYVAKSGKKYIGASKSKTVRVKK